MPCQCLGALFGLVCVEAKHIFEGGDQGAWNGARPSQGAASQLGCQTPQRYKSLMFLCFLFVLFALSCVTYLEDVDFAAVGLFEQASSHFLSRSYCILRDESFYHQDIRP